MDKLLVNLKNLYEIVPQEKVTAFNERVSKSLELANSRTGKGSEFLGWLNLPSSISTSMLTDIEETASKIRGSSQVVVVIGIGGSYLGAKAVIEALSHTFAAYNDTENPSIVFAGHNICEDYHSELIQFLEKRSYSIVVISKSGTTTEPAIAFRLLKQHLESKVGKAEASKRIVAITDQSKGALRKLATQEGYKTFVIPDDVGGRYSVLTPVGLLPIAIAGFNIRTLVSGAVDAEKDNGPSVPFANNNAQIYAAARNALYSEGFRVEIMVNYTPKLHFLTEWWKQLYGESEGKENKGIFPAGVDFTTDLHSLGQYIQEGERFLFETVVSVGNSKNKLTIPTDDANLDELNYIAGKRLSEVNRMAQIGTTLAHVDGKVPNILIQIPKISEYWIGYLMYFFEIACAVSGYTLGVNPFDQPGVEAYKKNMFALLGKEGFQSQGEALKKRIEK
ncbi:MAG TPA: glucose-6-phosphate isomerase [Tenuifilaceae bacterium]|nr:glucose-6-phosphate isomerase [Tenuifilaceae bacterium]HPE17742.1 glucose-6-phosphate isomerase [Tenuifilaceae bacterium]HPJ46433.1 glucose-6-phosphate isomerase [Tenuifilaceae bacterium]HPQ34984.1 glucose-6-phosphate isomerase [Tenuifilaceae bacterium]HRX68672.1 glucose-6-phosphate isomerase [Tenuifilaceae bacterium]